MIRYWKKVQYWLLGVLIASAVITGVAAYIGGGAAAVKVLEVIIAAWGALAMTATVVWALFSEDIRASLSCPVLDLLVSNKRPHCYLVGKCAPKSSSDTGSVVEVYGEVRNSSKTIANGCEVLCDSVFASTDGADKSYRKISSFCQSSFKWLDRNSTAISVSRSVSRYFRLAVIADDSNVELQNAIPAHKVRIAVSKLPEKSVVKNKPDKEVAKEIPSVRISLTDRATRKDYMVFDCCYRYFILPIRISCSGMCDAGLLYVWIKWNGKAVSDFEKAGMFEVLKKDRSSVRQLLSDEEILEEE